MNKTIVLVHSPLAGPLTWAPVSRELRRLGVETALPVLRDQDNDAPFWVQHAQSVAQRLEALLPNEHLLLVGHSGAGPLLPAIGAFSPHEVAGYIFVDAGLPHPGQSRLGSMESDASIFARELRRDLEAGGSFPQWTDEDLREIIPDEGLRRGMLAELRPRPLAFFQEPLPHIAHWPDAPYAYLKFSEAYTWPATQAQQKGWPHEELDGGHFHMLVDPSAVAIALLHLASALMQ